jgi:hypothetical protein
MNYAMCLPFGLGRTEISDGRINGSKASRGLFDCCDLKARQRLVLDQPSAGLIADRLANGRRAHAVAHPEFLQRHSRARRQDLSAQRHADHVGQSVGVLRETVSDRARTRSSRRAALIVFPSDANRQET